MKFSEALRLAEKNAHLVGRNESGGVIDEIIIYPTDPVLNNDFKSEYIATGDAQKSAYMFRDCDVRVGVVVNKFLIEENSIFIWRDISKLDNDLGAILE